MGPERGFSLLLGEEPTAAASAAAAWQALGHVTPYAILIINCFAFQAARSIIGRILQVGDRDHDHARPLRLFLSELVSTCELCADCAELNVVYEKHGSHAYALSLFLLTYLWTGAFGEAHTSPGYLIEELLFARADQPLRTSDAYARFIGQSIAMPLAWRLASLYWRYELIDEHRRLVQGSSGGAADSGAPQCRSSLTTSTLNGFAIELLCCLVCRLAELVGHRLLERKLASQRLVSATCSFLCTLLVVLALELSGGYFNPVLAASLEFGCQGISLEQHALVFWLGPLLGHLLARLAFGRYGALLEPANGSTTKTASGRAATVPANKRSRQQRDEAPAVQPTTPERPTRSSRRRRLPKSEQAD